jgi:O-antigen/teichoic acid export membrane protein
MADSSLLTPIPIDSPAAEISRVERLRKIIGLDRAVAFTVMARGWSSIAGIGTLALIARYLSAAEQGYYYTFYSLVALQIVFELGFSVVILQTATHEAAHLTFADDGRISGAEAAHARLASVLQKSVRWYTAAAVLMAAILLPGGMVFFSRLSAAHPSSHPVSWMMPWILIVVASMFTFQIDPIFSFLEGCGYVSQVARTRLLQAILGTSMGWTALLLHHGLLAPGCIVLGQATAGGYFVYRKRHLLRPLLRHSPGIHRISWGVEIWPFQWRIAVSWLCGYFIFQIFNPILFAYRGPVEAGQMGMSLNVCGTLSSMAIAWMNTKAAPFGKLVARREFTQLDKLFFRAMIQSTVAAVIGCAGVWGTIQLLRMYHIPFALRLLPSLPLALMFLATICNIIVFGEALYLRAHKQEKFMVTSIVGALWMAPTALILGRLYGASGIAIAYLCGAVFIGLGFGSYTFWKYRRLWHAT